ncbi:MAG: MFS transporter [Coleofasciculus sp. Co-bin14]|nr:MFS transporter [Coleofasciculus sp. Co-bin14]
MVKNTVDCILEETRPFPVLEVLESRELSEAVVIPNPPLIFKKASVRTSLQASTLDGVFATIFGCVTTGALLTNFLLELGATSVEIGFLSSIPLFVNLLQPLGAYLADRTSSRHLYSLLTFGFSRVLWVILLVLIAQIGDSHTGHHQLVLWTLGIVLATHILSALGAACWFSWMAALVPVRLRGRYFGIRNSAANFVNLLSVPLMGLAVSTWAGGAIQGYGVVLFFGIAAGLFSLIFQFFIRDVNPQEHIPERKGSSNPDSAKFDSKWFKDSNFLKFLLYCCSWAFAFNLSAPFFNLYMLDNLHLDVSVVTIYASLASGANLLMLLMWGKLADRIGNRPILVFVGILTAVTPLLWLGAGTNSASVWIWLPLVHLLRGGTLAAIDLCGSNMQMSLAPAHRQAGYFAIAAALAGITGAIGTALGGYLAQLTCIGGLSGLFALSAIFRLVALLPLMFVQEHRSHSLKELVRKVKLVVSPSLRTLQKPLLLLPGKSQIVAFQLARLTDRSKEIHRQ